MNCIVYPKGCGEGSELGHLGNKAEHTGGTRLSACAAQVQIEVSRFSEHLSEEITDVCVLHHLETV